MISDTVLAFYRRHGRLTDPGRHAAALRDLPNDAAALAAVVRGLLIHGDWLELYTLSDADFPDASRTTLPVAQRLDAILAIDASPLTEARAARRRTVGTCRDDALMLCALLRGASVPARVRCGFATYFDLGRYEDHWVCEYWSAEEQRWALADAQLDSEHCRHLKIEFDTSDLPTGAFVNAAKAWDLFASGAVDGDAFGHGDATGAWFLPINLERDLRALRKQETSHWDNWREIRPDQRALNTENAARCAAVAAAILIVDSDFAHFERAAAALCPNNRPL